MISPKIALASIAVLAFGALAPGSAQGLDMTGTWIFKSDTTKCSGWSSSGERFSIKLDTSLGEIRITEPSEGTQLIWGEGLTSGLFAGGVFGSEDKGVAHFAFCGDHGDMYLKKVKTFKKADGTFGSAKGDFRIYVPILPEIGGGGILSCKLDLVRTDVTPPRVDGGPPSCDPFGFGGNPQ